MTALNNGLDDRPISPRHAEALCLAALGVPVIICPPGTKVPNATPNGFKDRTTDPAIINGWFARADYNIAIVPADMGLTIIDVDSERGKEAAKEFGCDPKATRAVRTPRGGWHLYYHGVSPRKVGLAPGLDILSSDGIAVVPPSISGHGGYVPYEHSGAKVAPLPDPVVAAIARGKGKARREAAPGCEVDAPHVLQRFRDYLTVVIAKGGAPVKDTSRNTDCVRLANVGGDFGCSEAATVALLEDEWAAHGDAPDEPIRDIVKSAFKSRENAIGCDYKPEKTAPSGDPSGSGELKIEWGNEVEPEAVNWLWPGHYARGKFHLFAAKPETGKNLIVICTAAILSRGGKWPDGTRAPMGSTLFWSGEDSFKDTTLPRFMAAGGDRSKLGRVHDITEENGTKRPFDPARDVPKLVRAIENRPDILYVVIDPVSVVVSGGRGASNNNAETRRALQPLVDLAEARGIVVEGITHFTKDSQRRVILERIIESTAFGAAARVVHAANRFDDPAKARVWGRIKCNIWKVGLDVGFEYETVGADVPGYPNIRDIGRVEWGKPVKASIQALIAEGEDEGAEKDSAFEEAKREITALMLAAPGQQKLSSEMKRWVDSDACFSWSTAKRAKKALPIRTGSTIGAPIPEPIWIWTGPTDDVPPAVAVRRFILDTVPAAGIAASDLNTLVAAAGHPLITFDKVRAQLAKESHIEMKRVGEHNQPYWFSVMPWDDARPLPTAEQVAALAALY